MRAPVRSRWLLVALLGAGVLAIVAAVVFLVRRASSSWSVEGPHVLEQGYVVPTHDGATIRLASGASIDLVPWSRARIVAADREQVHVILADGPRAFAAPGFANGSSMLDRSRSSRRPTRRST